MSTVILLAHTQQAEEVVALAVKVCRSAQDFSELKAMLTPEKTRKLIKQVIKMGHLSVLEHAAFTFFIKGISRACSHQVVRHRIASFAQQSLRHTQVESDDFYYLPESLTQNPDLQDKFADYLGKTREFYKYLLQNGVAAEDARYILPMATVSNLVVTMNARELLHFFSLRTCYKAQEEIRQLAETMLKLVKPQAPAIFAKAGPPCINGTCPENDLNCPRNPRREKKTLE